MCKQNKCNALLIGVFTRLTKQLSKSRVKSFEKNVKNQRYSRIEPKTVN